MFRNTNRFWALTRPAVFALVGLLASAGTGLAQNLNGTFVAPDGSTATISHSGGTLRITNWAGPSNPDLRGSGVATGGPSVFRGTWQNRKGEWTGAGTWTITVVNADTIYVAAQGTVSHRGTRLPMSVAGYATRQRAQPRAQPRNLLAGTWQDHQQGLGQSTWTFTPLGNGTYRAEQTGLGNAHGTATLRGNQVRIDWKAANYTGTYSYTLGASGTSATGVSVLHTGRPGTYSASMQKLR